jgi:hypothetical protein
VADGIGHRGVEKHGADLQAGKVHAHCLAWLKRWHIPSLVDCGLAIADLQDCQLYFLVGYRISNDSRMPEWNPGAEFKAIRDASLDAGGKAP